MPPPAIDIFGQGVHSPPDEDNICLICHDTLIPTEEPADNNPPYKLECNHRYHATCIITWFRSGQSNCPYCGDLGSNAPKKNTRRRWRSWPERNRLDSAYQRLRTYSRRKDAPLELVKMVNKLKEYEAELDTATKDLKAFSDLQHSDATYRTISDKRHKLRKRKWACYRKAQKQKYTIAQYPIIPLIIPKFMS